MDNIKRVKLIKAMEFVARQVNDEEVLEGWLINGVADGDIEYGDLSVRDEDKEFLDYYIKDEEFAEMMALFLQLMSRAKKSGGLYCDNIVSK